MIFLLQADENIKMDGMDTMVFLDEISGRSGKKDGCYKNLPNLHS